MKDYVTLLLNNIRQIIFMLEPKFSAQYYSINPSNISKPAYVCAVSQAVK